MKTDRQTDHHEPCCNPLYAAKLWWIRPDYSRQAEAQKVLDVTTESDSYLCHFFVSLENFAECCSLIICY